MNSKSAERRLRWVVFSVKHPRLYALLTFPGFLIGELLALWSAPAIPADTGPDFSTTTNHAPDCGRAHGTPCLLLSHPRVGQGALLGSSIHGHKAAHRERGTDGQVRIRPECQSPRFFHSGDTRADAIAAYDRLLASAKRRAGDEQ